MPRSRKENSGEIMKMYGVYTISDGKYFRSTIENTISPCLRVVNELTAQGIDCVLVEDDVNNLLSSFEAMPRTIMEFKGINGNKF